MEEVLGRSKFDHYLNREERQAFVARIRRQVRLFVVQDTNTVEVEPLCRDSKDNKFLALALAAEADAVVSSDEDLLVLNPWRGIPILTPAEFLASGSDFPS
jgi:putative PIN family toxin of toxin-antitoxin system